MARPFPDLDEVKELQPNYADLPRKGKHETLQNAALHTDHLHILNLQPANRRLYYLPDLPNC